MKDPLNPSHEDIRHWAYSETERFAPMEDWDVIVFDDVSDETLNALVFDLAADAVCPKQGFFLRALYVMTGSVTRFAAQKGFHQANLAKLNALIARAEQNGAPLLAEWARKSKQVIRAPETFRYEDWY